MTLPFLARSPKMRATLGMSPNGGGLVWSWVGRDLIWGVLHVLGHTHTHTHAHTRTAGPAWDEFCPLIYLPLISLPSFSEFGFSFLFDIREKVAKGFITYTDLLSTSRSSVPRGRQGLVLVTDAPTTLEVLVTVPRLTLGLSAGLIFSGLFEELYNLGEIVLFVVLSFHYTLLRLSESLSKFQEHQEHRSSTPHHTFTTHSSLKEDTRNTNSKMSCPCSRCFNGLGHHYSPPQTQPQQQQPRSPYGSTSSSLLNKLKRKTSISSIASSTPLLSSSSQK